MDYLKLAEELSGVKRQMARIPDFRKMIEADNGENFALGYLADSAGSVSPKEIAGAMNVSSARVATILNKLESKGMVRRNPNLNDGRYTVVELLPAGRIQRQKNIEAFNRYMACFLEALGPEDAAAYVRLQKKIVDIYAKNLTQGKKDLN